MSSGKFIFGLALGVAAGVAGKIIYDNREEVGKMITEKTQNMREEIGAIVDYTADKADQISDGITEKVSEYSNYAKEQLDELKSLVSVEDDDFNMEGGNLS